MMNYFTVFAVRNAVLQFSLYVMQYLVFAVYICNNLYRSICCVLCSILQFLHDNKL